MKLPRTQGVPPEGEGCSAASLVIHSGTPQLQINPPGASMATHRAQGFALGASQSPAGKGWQQPSKAQQGVSAAGGAVQREKKELTLLGCAFFFFFWHPPSPPQQLPKSPGKPKPPGRLLPWREAVGGKTKPTAKKKGENQRIQCPKLTRNSNGGAMSKSSWLRPLY